MSDSKPAPSHSRCDHCSQSFECGVLSLALTILQKHIALENDSLSQAEYNAYLKEIETSGYRYPDSSSRCGLENNREAIRKFVQRAICLNDVFDARIAAGKIAPAGIQP